MCCGCEDHINCHHRTGSLCIGSIPVRGLLSIAILKVVEDKPTYGGEVQRALKERFSIDVPRAMIYGLLQRLERHGFLISTWDTSGSGPARRVYRITEEGEEYLKETLEKLVKVKDIIECLVSD